MLWTSLILLGLAIACWRSAQNYSDHVVQSLGGLFALVCLIVGIVTAPLPLRGMMLLGVMMIHPNCLSRLELRRKPVCDRLCLFRNQCRSSLKESLFAEP